MEGIWETVAKWAASASGSAMLMGAASTTMGILLATFIRTKIWPLTIVLAKCVLKLICALAGLAVEPVLKRLFQGTDMDMHECDKGKAGGTAPGKAQGENV